MVGGCRRQVGGLDAQVALGNPSASRLLAANAVNLQSDEAHRGHRVDEMRDGHTVDPGAQGVADGLNAEAVPLAIAVGLLSCGIQVARI